MRLPILLALAVIVLTPANIRDVAMDLFGQAQETMASVLNHKTEPSTLEVADAAAMTARHDTAKNSISNIR
jgi:hypothetical protein